MNVFLIVFLTGRDRVSLVQFNTLEKMLVVCARSPMPRSGLGVGGADPRVGPALGDPLDP